jgi:DNA-binding transcriptional LysR family regulator
VVGADRTSAASPGASGSAIAAPSPIAHAVTARLPWRRNSAFCETKNVAWAAAAPSTSSAPPERRTLPPAATAMSAAPEKPSATPHQPIAFSRSPSSPAASSAVAALERQVGVALLERQGRRVALTPAARLLVGRTERVLAELEAAEAELAAGDGDVRGSVRLAAFPTAAATLVPRAMATFAARHPDAEVLLSELEPEAALPALKLGEVDLAVIHEYDFSPRGADPSLELTPLAEDEIHVAVPAGHPAAGPRIALRALADERWVAGYLDTACHRVVVTACRAAGFEPRIAARSNDFRVVLALVAAGHGVALVPGLAVDRLPDGVALARPAERGLARRVVAAVRAGGGGRPAVASLLDALHEAAGHRLAASA